MIEIQLSEDQVFFHVRVTPGARRSSVGGTHDGALKISVREPADKGKANEAVIKLLAAELGLKRNAVEIKSGLTSRRKRIVISGPESSSIRDKLNRLAGNA